ncbi:MAG: putative sulfate exporter family transporter [Thermodesulfobacteriota bacterium]
MVEKKQGIDWSTIWKKDDWMSVWIGFLIIIIFLFGVTFKMPGFKWMTEGAFQSNLPEWTKKVEGLSKEAEQKDELGFGIALGALKEALATGDRTKIGKVAGKAEKISKEIKDGGLKKKAGDLTKKIKGGATDTIGKIFSGENLLKMLYALIGFLIFSAIGILIMGMPAGRFVAGFPFVFILSLIAGIVGGNSTIGYWGLETVFWALLLGLLVSNTMGVPGWAKEGVKTEYFIKIGLVLLGAEVLFTTIVKVGAYGMVQAIIVIVLVFYACFWVAKKLGLDDEFASILGTAVSICGVSAAIAAGGAVKGDPKKVSHAISLVLLCAIPMLIFEPLIAKGVGMLPAVAGAWIGGTIDTTGAVVAAGAIAGPEAMSVAVVVKMAQNVLIGVVAFILAVWFVFKGREVGEKPSAMEIWFRFPKFVLGFIVASIIFSFFMDENFAKAVTGFSKSIRGWWFNLAFICIGLDTKFKELVAMGGGKPAAAFLIAQGFNIILTLVLAYLIFGGIIFPVPTF